MQSLTSPAQQQQQVAVLGHGCGSRKWPRLVLPAVSACYSRAVILFKVQCCIGRRTFILDLLSPKLEALCKNVLFEWLSPLLVSALPWKHPRFLMCVIFFFFFPSYTKLWECFGSGEKCQYALLVRSLAVTSEHHLHLRAVTWFCSAFRTLRYVLVCRFLAMGYLISCV